MTYDQESVWPAFHEDTGFDPDGLFAGRFRYDELFEFLYPYRDGTFFDIVTDGKRVGLVAGERSGCLQRLDENEVFDDWMLSFKVLDAELRHKSFVGWGSWEELEYRFHSRILWSNNDDNFYFATDVLRHCPWSNVDRRSSNKPFGYIRVDRSLDDSCYMPTFWKRNLRTGRWMVEGLEAVRMGFKGEVCEDKRDKKIVSRKKLPTGVRVPLISKGPTAFSQECPT